jgi:5S rRNA maturation endonuclease (ribonuclease M5)
MAYTDKPTIILSDSNNDGQKFAQKLSQYLSDRCEIITNNDFFGDSIMNKEIQVLFENKPVKVLNLTLSYNFFNDMGLLKSFFEAITK